MSDGAGYGVKPSSAIGTIIGGKPHPEESELLSVEQMRNEIMATPITIENIKIESGGAYDTCCFAYAHAIIDLFLSDPKTATLSPSEIYDIIRSNCDEGSDVRNLLYSLSGFQVGWSTNAARRCVELEPIENPAIITIGE